MTIRQDGTYTWVQNNIHPTDSDDDGGGGGGCGGDDDYDDDIRTPS